MRKPYGLMADNHFHAWTAFAHVTPEGLNSRFAGLLSEMWRCAREVQSLGGNRIRIAGDVFHVRGSVSPVILNSVRDTMLSIYRELEVQFEIMPGNHDLEGKETTRLSSAVTALESPAAMIVSGAGYGIDGVCFVPWYESIDELKKVLQAQVNTSSKFCDLLIHAPIDGVITGLPSAGLSPEWLAELGFKRVFAGHYHNHKRFDGEVYSIGALAHHTWSDVGTKAGYLIVHEDRVDYRKSHLPEFIDLNQLTELTPDEIGYTVDKNYVRVKVEASKTAEVEKARKELMDMGAAAVIVQAQPKPPERTSDAARPTVAAGATLEVSVSNFIKDLAVDQAAVTKAALDVLTAVDSMGD